MELSLPQALEALKKAEISEVTVSYSGSGDSGCIDSVDGFSKGKHVELPAGVDDVIESRVYEVLDGLPDWYNNEGGCGEATLIVKDNRLDIVHTVYNDETENSKCRLKKGDIPSEILEGAPPECTKILFESEYDNGFQLAYLDSRGFAIDGIRTSGFDGAADDLVETAIQLSDVNVGQDDDWYRVEVEIDPKKLSATVARVVYTVRNSDSSGHEFQFDEEAPWTDSSGETSDAE